MAITDEAVISRLHDEAAQNAVDSSDEPLAMQSLCMDCYENVRPSIRRDLFASKAIPCFHSCILVYKVAEACEACVSMGCSKQ